MRLRLLACVSALVMVATISACGRTVGVNGSAGLSGVQPSTVPSTVPSTAPSPTPRPKVTVTVPAGPSASPAPSASASAPATTDPGGPIIPFPIITRIPILTLADCIAYNPNTVTYTDDGATGYVITDGSSNMLVVDNISDALAALTLVRNYNKQCFIGRDNPYTGNDRYRYIIDYWAGTGLSGTTVPTTDCIGYDNTALAINNLGSTGYQLVAGAQALAITASLSDANKAKSLAAAHHSVCFIGRSNTRANRAEYIVEYWV